MRKLTLILLLFGLYHAAFAQTKNIKGIVTDANDIALAGVTVSIQANSKSTITDRKGRYEIKASAGDVLEFSMIGMNREQITVGATDEINVRLTHDDISLSNVIITA